jgi:hypothetical protein
MPRILAGIVFCAIGIIANRLLSIEIAFGISLLFGNVFGILAALVLPWPFGALAPFSTMGIFWGFHQAARWQQLQSRGRMLQPQP